MATTTETTTTSPLPITMKALILNPPLKTASVHPNNPLPTPQVGELLIRVEAIALNPVDALYTSHPLATTADRTVGSDFSGTVVAVTPPSSPHFAQTGRDTTAIEIGQRVAGFLQGACSANPRPGAFAEYLVCPADLVWRVPRGVAPERAAAVSLCGLTAAQAVFYRLGLPAPFHCINSPHVLNTRDVSGGGEGDDGTLTFFIYGASTSVGMYAAQLVRRSSEAGGRELKLIGAASRARFDMLRAAPYAYDALVDYRDADWPERVRQITGGRGADFAYDCISEGETVKKVASTLREAGKMAVVRSRQGRAWAAAEGELPTEPIYGAVWEALGADIQYQGFVVKASEEARKFAAAFYRWLSEGGGLEPNPIRLMPGGLDRVVPDGFSLLGPGTMSDRRQDRGEHLKPISAEKLVYRVSEVGEE